MTLIPSEPTVFLVGAGDDRRTHLGNLIQRKGIQVQSFATGADFLEAYSPERPGCIVLDLQPDAGAALALQERLAADEGCPPVLVIGTQVDVPTAVRAMRNGAMDLLETPVAAALFLERIDGAIAADGERREHRILAACLRERFARLSTREREVLEIVVAGCPNKVVAERLGISTKTIEVHRAHAMKKMEARNLADLVKMAVALRVTSPAPDSYVHS